MKYALHQASRIGGRSINQDRVGYWSTPDCLLMAVADGLGGHPHGEVAAELAIGLLRAAVPREAGPRLAQPIEFLNHAIAAAHAAILRDAARRRLGDTPRTLLVACGVADGG